MANRSRCRESPQISLFKIQKSASKPRTITMPLVTNFIVLRCRTVGLMMRSLPPVILANGRTRRPIFIFWKRNVGPRNKIGSALGMPGRPFRPRRRLQRNRAAGLAAGRIMPDQQLRGDTVPHTEEGCDLPRTVRARACDCVHPVRAPDPEIRPAYPSQQQPPLHRRTDTEDKNLL